MLMARFDVYNNAPFITRELMGARMEQNAYGLPPTLNTLNININIKCRETHALHL